jgi:hypothetical protein
MVHDAENTHDLRVRSMRTCLVRHSGRSVTGCFVE